ncbi:Pyrophosphate-energized vacuolar membrane proton pump [Hordeum vulgare]|nr:Pyrophosphate-energized vacuolar membrane proton pump [Hordeum vulgare]
MSWRADPLAGPADFESHRERSSRHGKERIRIAEAYLTEEMTEAADAAARASAQEEAIRARILKKWHSHNTRTLAHEQNRVVREMAGLPSKEVKEVSGGEDNSGDEQIRLNLYCIFDRYFRNKDDKGAGKDKDSRG